MKSRGFILLKITRMVMFQQSYLHYAVNTHLVSEHDIEPLTNITNSPLCLSKCYVQVHACPFACGAQMTISGLIFQASHTPLRKVFPLAWNSDRLGVAVTEHQKSSYNLFLGVSYHTWLLF